MHAASILASKGLKWADCKQHFLKNDREKPWIVIPIELSGLGDSTLEGEVNFSQILYWTRNGLNCDSA